VYSGLGKRREQEKRKRKPNPEDGDWKKIIDHRYPALIKSHIFISEANKIRALAF
jgi:hypothetical protein